MADSIDIDPRVPAAEFIGTFALIFVGAGSAVATGGTNLVGIAIAHGLAIALLITALGHFSGGFFNPALTIGLWVTQQLDTLNTIAYIIAQLVGAVVAALALLWLFPDGLVESDVTQLGTPLLNKGVSFAQGVGIEAVLTVFLMLVLLGTAVGARRTATGGFSVGLAVSMGMLAALPLTGAAMNPARAFGPALIDGTWDDHLIYWIGPIVGAVLAALLHQYLFAGGPAPMVESGMAAMTEEPAAADAWVALDEPEAEEERLDEDPTDSDDEFPEELVNEASGNEDEGEEENSSL